MPRLRPAPVAHRGSPRAPVGVLLAGYPGMLRTSLALAQEMLEAANSVLRARRRAARFEIGEWRAGDPPGAPAATISEPELCVVAAVWGNPQPHLRRNRDLVGLLASEPLAATRLVGVGSGAFFLAEAGRLDGRAATTHWSQFERFARRYPRVQLRRDHRIVESGGSFTVASLNALGDLMVHLVAEACGAEVGRVVERHFSYESRNPFGEEVFSERAPRNVADELVAHAQALLTEDLADPLGVDQVAARLDTSRRTLHRRFRRATGLSPLEYRRRARMETAAELLRRTDLAIQEVAERCGIPDRRYFARQFRETLGVAPREYRKVVRAKLFTG